MKILGDCRDIASGRMRSAFSGILNKVGDVLMDRAMRTDVREEQQMLLDARAVLKAQHDSLLADFEKRFKQRIDDGLSGRPEAAKVEFAQARPGELTLVETATMDESVIRGNLKRVVENLCHDELQQLNRAVGHLLGRPELETDGNPMAPGVDRGLLRRGAEGDQDRDADQVPGAEGAEPGLAGRSRRDLRRPQQAPRRAQGRSPRRCAR